MALFGARVDAALRAVVDLALADPAGPRQGRDIAQRQGISAPFVEQVMMSLRRHGLVASTRGMRGGYALVRSPAQITVGDVVRAAAGPHLLVAGACVPNAVRPGATHAVTQFEMQAEERLHAMLDETTIDDLARRQQQTDDALSLMPGM